MTAPEQRSGRRVGGCEVAVEDRGDRTVLRVRGDLDVVSAPEQAATFREASRAEKHLVVDFADARFIDSSGLSLLLNCARRATTAGRHCVVVCPPGPVLRVLEMTGLAETLRVQPDRRAADAVLDAAPDGPFRAPPSTT